MSAGRRGGRGGGGTILRAAVSQCNRGRSSIQESLRKAEEGEGEDTDQGMQLIVVDWLCVDAGSAAFASVSYAATISA